MTRAVDLSPDENSKLKFTARRYAVLDGYKPRYPDFQADQNILTSQGFKKDDRGIGIALVTKIDTEFWIGGELSLFSLYGPMYKAKDKSHKTILQRKFSIAASGFTFGYSRSIDTKMNDYSFSLIRIEAPLFIDLIKFGYISRPEGKSLGYYRPEIGIGYSYFLLSGAYTVFFDGEAAESISKLHLNFRVKYTF